ncbi:MAG: MATE family efflux transporter [Candidatus Neomarinimicrobiota bacterium]|nr:MATE family efflux transporter [Candidatus Neomarinimicrobiota bacterium]
MDFNQNKESRLNEFIDNPKRSLWKLSLPMMFGMSVQAIYMMVDTAFVGRMLGGTALASLGYVFPFIFILMGITFGLGSGATTVIAQFIGSKDKENADNAAKHTIILGLLIGIVIIIIGFMFGEKLLKIQGADDDTITMALDYFHIMIYGSIFMILSIFFRSIMSGAGEMMLPMIIMGIGTILNIILDPFLIYHYKITGAALATIISQIIVTFIFIYYLFINNKSYISFNFNSFKLNSNIIKRIFYLGIPASLSMIIMSMGLMLFNGILGSSEAVAAYQTAGRIEHFFFLPIISIATSLVTLVGMYFGAKRIDLISAIVKYSIQRGILIACSFSLFFFFFTDDIITIFVHDKQITELTVLYFKIMAFAYPFITIGMTSSRVMQGLGHSIPMFMLTLFRVVIISASLAWYFVIILKKPVYYAWIGTLISCVLTAIISIAWLKTIINKYMKTHKP